MLVFKIIAADALYHEGLGNIVPKSQNAESAEHFAIITNAINLAKDLKIKSGKSKSGPFMDIDRSDIPNTTNLGPNGHELFVQSYNQAIKDHNEPINNVLINDQLNNQRVLNQISVLNHSKTADQDWKTQNWKTQTFLKDVNGKKVKISYENYEKLIEFYNKLFEAYREYPENTNFTRPNIITPPENISSESDLIHNYTFVADECKKLRDFLKKKSTVTVTADQDWKTQTFFEKVNEKEVEISYENYEKLIEFYNKLFKEFGKYPENVKFIRQNGITPPENISSGSDLIQNYRVVASECKKLQDFLINKEALKQIASKRRKFIDSDDTEEEDSDTDEENNGVSTSSYISDVSPKSLKKQMDEFTNRKDNKNIDELKVKIQFLIENLEKEISPLTNQLTELKNSKNSDTYNNGTFKEKNRIAEGIKKIGEEITIKNSDIEAYKKLISLPEQINSAIPKETTTSSPFNKDHLYKASNKKTNTNTNTDTDTDNSGWE